MNRAEQIADEAKLVRKVTHIVDIATALITQSDMSRRDAEMLVAKVREWILMLFPDGEQTYELIYAPRFRRLIEDFTPLSPRGPGVS